MQQFLYDIWTCLVQFSQFMVTISTSIWMYPVLLFFFIGVFFYLVSDNH